MTVDIFIRTYHKDLEWLKYCLRSIHKYVTGYRQIIISIPANEQHLLKPFNLTAERVVPAIVGKNGYILQQVSKLTAYKETDAEYILFVDSDVCYKEPCDISEYFRDGKPIIFETPWELVGDAKCWRECTEEILGFSTDTEKMRRMCVMYHASTLRRIDERFSTQAFVNRKVLSEFNLVGSFAKHYEPENYYFWNTVTEPDIPPQRHRQFWSHSGLTKEEREEMERFLA